MNPETVRHEALENCRECEHEAFVYCGKCGMKQGGIAGCVCTACTVECECVVQKVRYEARQDCRVCVLKKKHSSTAELCVLRMKHVAW